MKNNYSQQKWPQISDPMECYFARISSCNIEDGKCISVCGNT